MKMKEIDKGIYRYNGELSLCNDNPLVLVHPWYDEETQEFNIYNKQKVPYILRTRGYLKNLDRLLENSSKRNVFLFEGVPFNYSQLQLRDFSQEELLKNFINSWERIINLRGDKGLYGVVTEKKNPKPFFESWESALKFIKSLSNNVELSGGYLSKSSYYDSYDGCVGVVYGKLLKDDFKVKLAEGCCFTF